MHPNQEERFEILSGNVRFRKGMRKIDAKAGDVVVVEPGEAHKFKNAGESGAAMRMRVSPALEMERLFETAVNVAENGRVTKKGMPKPLDLALFVREFKNEVRGPGSPGWIQRASLAPLALLARGRGRGESYTAAQPACASRPRRAGPRKPAGSRPAGFPMLARVPRQRALIDSGRGVQ